MAFEIIKLTYLLTYHRHLFCKSHDVSSCRSVVLLPRRELIAVLLAQPLLVSLLCLSSLATISVPAKVCHMNDSRIGMFCVLFVLLCVQHYVFFACVIC